MVPLVPPRPAGVPAKAGSRPVALFQPKAQLQEAAVTGQSAQPAFASVPAKHSANKASAQPYRAQQRQSRSAVASTSMVASSTASSERPKTSPANAASQQQGSPSAAAHNNPHGTSVSREAGETAGDAQTHLTSSLAGASDNGPDGIQLRHLQSEPASSGDVLTTYSSFGHDQFHSYNNVAAPTGPSQLFATPHDPHESVITVPAVQDSKGVSESDAGPVFNSLAFTEDVLTTIDGMTELRL